MPVVITKVPMPGCTAEVPTPGQSMEKSTRKDQGEAQHIIAAAEARAIITITETQAALKPGPGDRARSTPGTGSVWSTEDRQRPIPLPSVRAAAGQVPSAPRTPGLAAQPPAQ